MTDDQKILGMIPAKALGCLDDNDNLSIQSYIDEGSQFPWNELGVYQQIAALLPLSLQIETPDPQLKDNVALRLIKLTEELRAKELQEEEERLALQKAQEEEERLALQKAQEEEERLALQKAQEEEERLALHKAQEEEERLALHKAQEEEERLALQKAQEELETPREENEQFGESMENSFPVEESETVQPFNLDDIELPENENPAPFSLTDPIEEEQSFSEETENLVPSESQLYEESTLADNIESTEDQFAETNSKEIESHEDLPEENLVQEESISEEQLFDEPLEETQEQTTAPIIPQSELVDENESITEDDIKDNRSKYAKMQDTKKKTLDEKMYRALEVDLEEAISSFNRTEKKLTKNLLIAYIAIAVLFALLIFSFFKFTADINTLENEVKKKPTSQLIENKNIEINPFSLS
jgi:hypothetical protein